MSKRFSTQAIAALHNATVNRTVWPIGGELKYFGNLGYGPTDDPDQDQVNNLRSIWQGTIRRILQWNTGAHDRQR